MYLLTACSSRFLALHKPLVVDGFISKSLQHYNLTPPYNFHLQAIEEHDLESVKQSISRIKTAASAWGVSAPLDVFYVLKRSGMVYVMSLIAFSGVHGQKEIVELLLDEGASKY